MRVAVTGVGYVGPVTGACFADPGHTVCCIDRDRGKIDALNQAFFKDLSALSTGESIPVIDYMRPELADSIAAV